MNKTAIKNFAIWARNKLIAEITYKAGLLGITEAGIKAALPQSGDGIEYYDIGTREPYAVSGTEIRQRQDLVAAIEAKRADSDYRSAYGQVIDEVAYTWFNRLIAVRFMEINDYLPSQIRVLSSVSGKNEPDIVTMPFDAWMEYTAWEKARIIDWKNQERLDEVFRYLFLKQCNELNEVLPALFEKVSDYTELLLTVSFTDKDGVVYHLVHDIPEEDFNVEIGGQVEIIGWLYQYYNTEPKAKVFARASGTKIKKEEIPAATQLFTPDWIVRYMVENSLGRLWVEGHPNDELKANWKYYLEEAEQEPDVQRQLAEIRREYALLNPEDLLCIDPCMGSGHILCYFFDVLMQIYESQGYTRRDAAQSILEHNIWGVDIDDRAYQLAYFAVMMKGRQYDRRILSRGLQPHVYAIAESNGFNKEQLKYFGATLEKKAKNNALNQVNGLLEQLYDAKEYGSILSVDTMEWELLREFAGHVAISGQMDLDAIGVEKTQEQLERLIDVGEMLAKKYWVTCTNPPYMAVSNASEKMQKYVKGMFPDSKSDLFAVFIERCGQLAGENGYQAMITQHAWMFLSGFEKLRDKLLNTNLINMIHLGSRAFDAIGGEVVQTTSFVLRKSNLPTFLTSYCRVVQATTQNKKEDWYLQRKNRFDVSQSCFRNIKGAPYAYWAGKGIFKAFVEGKPLGNYYRTLAGSSTGDNARFLKLWSEVAQEKIGFNVSEDYDGQMFKWIPCFKGGGYRKWYGHLNYIMNWENNGKEIKYWVTHNPSDPKTTSWSRRLFNTDLFFHKGINWSKITTGNFSARYMPEGFIIESASCGISPDEDNILSVLAFLNSKIVENVLQMLNPTINIQVGDVMSLPVLDFSMKREIIDKLADACISLAKGDWDSLETSWDFKIHPLVHGIFKVSLENTLAEKYIEASYIEWEKMCDFRFAQLKSNEEELNRIFIDIYGLQDELTPEVEDEDVTVRKADLQRDIKSLLSYAVGCMFGRYSLDVSGLAYAGGEWDDSKYSTFIPKKDNVLLITDEEYIEDDIVGLFCAWLKKVYGADTLEENLDFIARALGNKGNSSREVIRNYFLNDFFKDHCSTYSVTGSGKRPIYWLYDSGKQNGFKALIYLHRYNADTTGRVRANYLHRMEKIYASEIDRMEETIQNSKNNREVAAATKRKEKLQRQVKECREYDEKIAHLALARIEIDLDDGVKVNYRKVQTDKNGRFYEILADSKNIMVKN